MLDFDFLISVIVLIQPPVVSFIIFNLTKNFIFINNWFEQLFLSRKKKKSIKFFECSVYSRLINHFQYDIHCIIFCILFILYDVDLLFFFSEALFLDNWSLLDFFLFTIYIIFFLLGFWYDYERYSLYWSF
jgi:NADH:ubiquinone oxidoreductase subunit 3 (subunit A)